MKYRKTCKATRRPLRWWKSGEGTVTEHCYHGDCATCTQSYIGYFMYSGHDMWANEHSLCFNITENELLAYGDIYQPEVNT